jgi:hypothetical protein
MLTLLCAAALQQVEEGLCQLVAMLWLDSQDCWAKQQQGQYQERLLSYLGYQVGGARTSACMKRQQQQQEQN